MALSDGCQSSGLKVKLSATVSTACSVCNQHCPDCCYPLPMEPLSSIILYICKSLKRQCKPGQN